MSEKKLLIMWIGNLIGIAATPLFVIWGEPSWLSYSSLQWLVLGLGVTSAIPAVYYAKKFRALVAKSSGNEDDLFDINHALSLWGMITFLPCLLGVAHFMVTGTYVGIAGLTVLSVILMYLFKPTKQNSVAT